MRTSCPLYYNTADILAAFSQNCEGDAPPSATAVGGRLVSTVGIMASALAWPAAISRRLNRLGDRGTRPATGPASGSLPFRGANNERNGRRPPDLGLSCKPSLRSHFALVAPAD